MKTCLAELTGITKEYPLGPQPLVILGDIEIAIENGEFIAVTGPSGSGKTTLLNILGCLERPTMGNYKFEGREMLFASDHSLSRLRAVSFGFVFQTFNLVPSLTLFENVALPFLYSRTSSRSARRMVLDAIEQVGLSDRLHHRPAELSGGEMQRAAIARAIAIKPKMILADEPTGNLDSSTGHMILEIFQQLNHRGTTIVMVTHDSEVAAFAQRTIYMRDGKIAGSA